MPALDVTDDERTAHRDRARRSWAWVDHPQVAHNDAVRYLGGCRSPHHTDRSAAAWCAGPTDPEVARALAAKEERDLRRRLVTGRASVTEYVRHAPWMLTGRNQPRR